MKVLDHLIKLKIPGQMTTEPATRKTEKMFTLYTGSEKNHAHKRKNKYVDVSKSEKPETLSCMIHGSSIRGSYVYAI